MKEADKIIWSKPQEKERSNRENRRRMNSKTVLKKDKYKKEKI